MRRLVLFLALAPLLTFAEPAPKLVNEVAEIDQIANDLIVATTNIELPANESDRARYLWDTFANKPEEKQFAGITTKDWRAKWDRLAGLLVKKAAEASLDSENLRLSLKSLRHGQTEMTMGVPVPAIQSSWGDTDETREAHRKELNAARQQRWAEVLRNPDAWPTSTATVPVSAYLAHHAGGDCWIIISKWENAAPALALGHIRIWAVDCATHKIIGFTGCD